MKIVDKDLELIDSWHNNAAPGIVAIEERHIESHKLVIDRAIIDVAVSQNGHKIPNFTQPTAHRSSKFANPFSRRQVPLRRSSWEKYHSNS